MIDIYVIFEDVVFTIEFDTSNDDVENQKVLVAYGKKFKDIKAPKAVSNDGLKFVHWEDKNGVRVTNDYLFTEDNTFKPVWTDKVISLTFDAGDGSFDDGITEIIMDDVAKGMVLEEIEGYVEPTQKGKEFDYWEVEYIEEKVEEVVEDNEDNNDDAADDENDVNYEEDDEEKNDTSDKDDNNENTTNEDDEETVEDNEIEKTENDLAENAVSVSSTSAGGNGAYASGGSGIDDSHLLRTHTIEKSAVLKAVYKDATIQLKVDLNYHLIMKRTVVSNNGNNVTYETCAGGTMYKDVPKDSTFKEFLETWKEISVEEGYEFVGWMRKVGKNWEEFTEEDQNAPLTENAYIMASFNTLTWNVVVDANGGKYSDGETTKVYNDVKSSTFVSKIPGFENPTRNGYKIVGYSRNKYESNSKMDLLNLKVTSNHPIYVIWAQNSVAPVTPSGSSTRRSSGGGGGGSSSSGGGSVEPSNNTPTNGPDNNITPNTNVQDASLLDASSNSMNNLFMSTTGSNEVSKLIEAKSNQSLSQASLNEVNTYVNSLLVASGLQNNQTVMSNTLLLSKTNEIAKGKDYQKQLETILTEAKTNPTKTNQKAEISTQNISANNASWTYDNQGNIKLTDKSTNQQVTNKWQAVGDNNGNKTWYKFDESGNMQTGLVVDGGLTYYLKDTNDANRGKMAVNETVSIGGLSLTFNQDGALTNMSYDEAKAINSLSHAIINAVSNPVS